MRRMHVNWTVNNDLRLDQQISRVALERLAISTVTEMHRLINTQVVEALQLRLSHASVPLIGMFTAVVGDSPPLPPLRKGENMITPPLRRGGRGVALRRACATQALTALSKPRPQSLLNLLWNLESG